jgi:hypothetical protein
MCDIQYRRLTADMILLQKHPHFMLDGFFDGVPCLAFEAWRFVAIIGVFEIDNGLGDRNKQHLIGWLNFSTVKKSKSMDVRWPYFSERAVPPTK